MSYVFAPRPAVAVPVVGTDASFPVHRVYCVGRNFAAHAVEMGHDPDKEPPFFFQKNPDNLLVGADFPYPALSSDVHHEIEMSAVLSSGGDNIALGDALAHVYGYAVSLDMTRRDLQGVAKDMGRPWEVGKAFEHSGPCGPVMRAADIGHPSQGAIWLKVNGRTRQQGDLNQMIWKVPEVISYLSELFTLSAGDVIMTGTPSGVGPVERGDRLHGFVEGVGELRLAVV